MVNHSQANSRTFGPKRAVALFSLVALFAVLSLVGKVAFQARAADSPYTIVASTTILADLTRQVAGDRAVVTSLLAPGMDPHVYQPVPGDHVRMIRADVVVLHGQGLDAWAERMVASAASERSAGLKVVAVGDDGEPAGDPDRHDHAHGNPHHWLDPLLVVHYIETIRDALAEADPAGAETYRSLADGYIEALRGLDTWIREQVALIPPGDRKLVTNHDTFVYFARRYGFEVVGAVMPGFSSESEPSARMLADLIHTVREAGVRAVFTETTANTALARTLAREAGGDIRLAALYTESLSAEDGPAPNYLEMMRYNVRTIVDALTAP